MTSVVACCSQEPKPQNQRTKAVRVRANAVLPARSFSLRGSMGRPPSAKRWHGVAQQRVNKAQQRAGSAAAASQPPLCMKVAVAQNKVTAEPCRRNRRRQSFDINAAAPAQPPLVVKKRQIARHATRYPRMLARQTSFRCHRQRCARGKAALKRGDWRYDAAHAAVARRQPENPPRR